MTNLGRYLEALSVRDAACVEFGDRMFSVAEIHAAVEGWAETLRDAGVERGDVVALRLRNGPGVIVGLHACWKIGAVAAPVSPVLSDTEFGNVMQRLRPRLFLVNQPGNEGELRLPLVRTPQGWRPEPRAEDDALVLHSSGTTGPPKPVFLSHSTLAEGLEPFARGAVPGPALELGGLGRPVLIAFPLFHLAGIANLLVGLATGRSLLVMDRFEPEGFARLVSRHGLRAASVNPTMLQMLLTSDRVDPTQLRTLKVARSGSASLSADLVRRFRERFGTTVVNSYGQTETGGEVIGWSSSDVDVFADAKAGSIGRVRPGVEIVFLDQHGVVVSEGQVGELCVRSPGRGQPQLMDDPNRFTPGGFLRTGDLGYVDEEGFVWLVGRTSDVIICGGFKIMPEEIEQVLERHPRVAEVMVTGVEDERLGEIPVAFIVPLGPAAGSLIDELAALARNELAPYKAPRRFEIVARLPRNEFGKLRRRQASPFDAAPTTLAAHR